jgi:hypothetical protein
MERDQITGVLEDVGAVVLANACGPCIGQVHCSLFNKVYHSIHILVSVVETRGHKRGGKWWAIFCSLKYMYVDSFKAILTSFNRSGLFTFGSDCLTFCYKELQVTQRW